MRAGSWRCLPKRFARFGLTIHPQKTALVAFGTLRQPDDGERGKAPSTFWALPITGRGHARDTG